MTAQRGDVAAPRRRERAAAVRSKLRRVETQAARRVSGSDCGIRAIGASDSIAVGPPGGSILKRSMTTRFGGKDAAAERGQDQNLGLRWRVRARMLNWLWLAAALALAGGCVTVPAKEAGIDAGSTNSALNPNGTKFSRFWKRQTDKIESLARKPAPNRVNTAPPNAEFYLTMAIAQEQAGNLDNAEEFYQKALASDPKSLATLTGYAHFEDRRRHLIGRHEALQTSSGETSRRGQRLQRSGALLSASRHAQRVGGHASQSDAVAARKGALSQQSGDRAGRCGSDRRGTRPIADGESAVGGPLQPGLPVAPQRERSLGGRSLPTGAGRRPDRCRPPSSG